MAGADSGVETFACPGCGRALAVGTATCPDCGIRLVGEDAARLWAVHQQIATLQAEADRLLAAMRGTPVAEPERLDGLDDQARLDDRARHEGRGSMTAGMPTAPPTAPAPAPAKARGLSGQGILLALGGLLLLSGASVFVVVVWLLVGVYGQALLMAAATVGAVAIARALGKRDLHAGAETFAVIGCGLLLLDLWGAHHLGFAGTDDVPGHWYAAFASLFGAACAVLADRVTRPRRFAYAPFAAALALTAPWWAVAALDVAVVRFATATAVAFLVDLVLLSLVVRAEGTGWRRSPAVVVATGVTAVGLVVFVCTDLGIGFDTGRSRTVHLSAAALALVVPVVIVLALLLRLPERLGARVVPQALVVRVIAAFVAAALGMTVFDAPIGVLIAIAVVLAAVVIAGAVWSVHDTVRAVADVAAVAQGVLACWVAVDSVGLWEAASPAVHAIPAVVWTLTAIVRSVTDRELVWVVVAEVAVALSIARGFADASTRVGVVVTACGLMANTVVGGVAARRPRRDPARGGLTFAYGLEIVAVLFGVSWAIAMIGLAIAHDETGWAAAAFWVAGVAAAAHATAPERLPFAYLGAIVAAVGTWVLLGDRNIGVVEAYSLPFAAMLAIIGLVQARRSPEWSTMLTAGPALTVAVVPSLIAAIDTGTALRLAAITLVGLGLLVVGLQRHWQAPVTVGVLALVVIAVTQGGPLVAYVPSWLTLTVVGALLLVIGVRWEAAVGAGRRAGVWYGALR